MSQSWTPPTGGDTPTGAIVTKVQGMLDALRSLHSGASEPSNTVAYMLWSDTTNALLKIRNAANDGWVVLGALGTDASRQAVHVARVNLTASVNLLVPPLANAGVVKRVTLVSDTTTTSDGSNNWAFQIRNKTQATNLLSTAANTNGAEITADVVYAVTPDQNATVAADDVLELQVTETGTATSLTNATFAIEYGAA